MQALIRTSDGDLRRAITYLQSASRLASATGEPISPEGVQEIGGVVPDSVLRELGRALGVRAGEDEDGEDGDVEMKSAGGSPFDRVRAAVEKVSREGYSAVQVLSQVRPAFSSLFSPSHGPLTPPRPLPAHVTPQLHDLLILDPLVPARAKASIALDLGLADKALTDGADEELQLLNCCARIERAVRGV